MLNQIILVGRLADDVEIIKEEEKEIARIILACQRPYKNGEGEYETDFIPITLWNAIASNTAEYCKKGDIIGVKGRTQSNKNEDGTYGIQIIAEKVTFLSSRQPEDKEGKNEEKNSNN